MGKNKKKSKSSSPKNREAKRDEEEVVVTMQALEAMSDSDDSSGLPPEEEWDEEAKSLKQAIEEGIFNKLASKMSKKKEQDDEDSIEEVVLDDEEEKASKKSKGKSKKAEPEPSSEEEEEEEESGSEESSDEEEETKSKANSAVSKEEVDNNDESEDEEEEEEEEEAKASKEEDEEEENEEETSDNEQEEKKITSALNQSDDHLSIPQLNAMRQKSLRATANEILASQEAIGWPETFDIMSSTPLPFGVPKDNEEEEEDGVEYVDIHDDLKREVTFYNMALEAATECRRKCVAAKIPFSRPENFFAEMVKTDDHMAKVKDRLIFENKKMEAVSQRKSNKEQKLRAKESHANKLAEKAKRKKDNLRAVDDYAQSAASRRGGRLDDDDGAGAFEPNKKRMAADKKYGFGGKRGRFKKSDPKALNDYSGFNARGNFPAGQKRIGGAGAGNKRPGKRARDSARSRR